MPTKKPATKKTTKPAVKRPGRKPSGEPVRSGRISMRTYPDVEKRAKQAGTEAVEEAIRGINK
jgi:hypothetical protein